MARYCLKCFYPLDQLPFGICPECGRTFDAEDKATFSAVPRRTRAVQLPTPVVWVLTFLVSWFWLFTLQWGLIAWWHKTSTLWWFASVRGGSWWVLKGNWELVFRIQHAILIVWALVFATLLVRRISFVPLAIWVVVVVLTVGLLLVTGLWIFAVVCFVVLGVAFALAWIEQIGT